MNARHTGLLTYRQSNTNRNALHKHIVEKTYKVIRRVLLSIILLFYPKVTKKTDYFPHSAYFP